MEWESLDTSSKIFENTGYISCTDGLDKGQKWYGPNEAEDIKKR